MEPECEQKVETSLFDHFNEDFFDGKTVKKEELIIYDMEEDNPGRGTLETLSEKNKPSVKLESDMENMNFAVVTFPEDCDSLGVIPTNWINETGQTCRYPTVTSDYTKNKLIYTMQDPKSDWKEFKIRILKSYEKYETAKSHLSDAEFTSNIDSDTEATTTRKRPRKEKKIILPGEESSSSDEDEMQNKKKNMQIPEFPQPPCSSTKLIPQHFLEHTTSTTHYTELTPLNIQKNYTAQTSPASYYQQKQTPSPRLFLLQTTPTQDLTASSKWRLIHKSKKKTETQQNTNSKFQKGLFSLSYTNSTASLPPTQPLKDVEPISLIKPALLTSSSSGSSSSSISADITTLKRNQEMMWEILGEFSQKLDTILETLSRMENRFSLNEPERQPNNQDCEFIAKLPLTKANFLEFEDKLQEQSFRQKVVRLLINANGTSIKNFAANVMKKLLLDEVAEEYSLTGKHGNGAIKKPFIKTRTFLLVSEICFRKYKNGEETKVREGVSDWLMQAKFRRLRREKRGAAQTACPSENTSSDD